jgi:hypothetical protein
MRGQKFCGEEGREGIRERAREEGERMSAGVRKESVEFTEMGAESGSLS